MVQQPTGSIGSTAPPLVDVPTPLNSIGESRSEEPFSGSDLADDDFLPSGKEGGPVRAATATPPSAVRPNTPSRTNGNVAANTRTGFLNIHFGTHLRVWAF